MSAESAPSSRRYPRAALSLSLVGIGRVDRRFDDVGDEEFEDVVAAVVEVDAVVREVLWIRLGEQRDELCTGTPSDVGGDGRIVGGIPVGARTR